MVNRVLSRFALTKNPFTKDVPVEELFEHDSSDGALRRLKAAVEGRSSRTPVAPFPSPKSHS